MASRENIRALEGMFANANGASSFGLLVDAANAQQQSSNNAAAAAAARGGEERQQLAAAAAALGGDGSLEGMQRAAAVAAQLGHFELQEALQREVLEQRAAQAAMSAGLPAGLAAQQEAEYLQQLRLEALVQQRRQETLAQLALAQEGGMAGGDLQALLQAQQLRQAALMRQDLLGVAGLPPGYEHLGLGGGLGGAFGGGLGGGLGGATHESLYLQQLLEEREKQVKLAALASAGGMNLAALGGEQGLGLAAGEGGMAGLPPGLMDAGRPESVASALEHSQQKPMVNHSQQKPMVNHSQQKPMVNHSQQQPMANHSQQQPMVTREPEVAQQMPMAISQEDDGSKTTVLPCRARGMPMDHNVKTAYFVINEDIKHGTELVCSYFACRNAGIKFRYCTYCKLPVAKRNFCKRHKHTGKIPAENIVKDLDMSSNGDDSSDDSQSDTKAPALPVPPVPPPKVVGPPPKKTPDKKPKAKASGKSTRKRTLKVDANDALQGLVKEGIEELIPNDGVKEPLSEQQVKEFSKLRMEKWTQLLNKRPRYDRDAMLFWVQDILATSDFDMPLEGEEPIQNRKVSAAGQKPKKKSEIREKALDTDAKDNPIVSGSLKQQHSGTSVGSTEISAKKKVDAAAGKTATPMELDAVVEIPKKVSAEKKEGQQKQAIYDKEGSAAMLLSLFKDRSSEKTKPIVNTPETVSKDGTPKKSEECKDKDKDNVKGKLNVGIAAVAMDKVAKKKDPAAVAKEEKSASQKEDNDKQKASPMEEDSAQNTTPMEVDAPDKKTAVKTTKSDKPPSEAVMEESSAKAGSASDDKDIKANSSNLAADHKKEKAPSGETKKGGKKALFARIKLDDSLREKAVEDDAKPKKEKEGDKREGEDKKETQSEAATEKKKDREEYATIGDKDRSNGGEKDFKAEDHKPKDSEKKIEDKPKDDENKNDVEDDEKDEDSSKQSGSDESSEEEDEKLDNDDAASTSSDDSVDLRASKRK